MKSSYFPLTGGVDLTTAPLSRQPGTLINSINFEQGIKSGYALVEGFERYNGKPSPSTASTELKKVSFTNGSVAFTVGNTLTGGGVIEKIIETSGTWAAGTMVGTLYLRSCGTYTSGTTLSDGTGTATSSSADLYLSTSEWQAQQEERRTNISEVPGIGNILGVWVYKHNVYAFRNIDSSKTAMYKATSTGWTEISRVFEADGTYEFLNYNFYGASDLEKMFWVSGVDTAYMYDGTTVTPITTGMTIDKPDHITAHKNCLFLSFPGGSVQRSSSTDPTAYTLVVGTADELMVGDDVTWMNVLSSDTLAVLSRNSITFITGDIGSMSMAKYSYDAGAISGTIQWTDSMLFLDDRGLMSLSTTQKFGNFKHSSISQKIDSYIDTRRSLITTTLSCKTKNQYRLFFSDNTSLFITMSGNKIRGAMPVNYGKTVKCACNGEDLTGKEIMFFGSTDGYVYQCDKGTNFDGSEISAYLKTSFWHYKSPTTFKRFRRMEVEFDDAPPSLKFQPNFSYADARYMPKQDLISVELPLTGALWGDGSKWGNFYWGGGAEVVNGDAFIDGVGFNLGLIFRSNTTYDSTFTIHGVTITYTPLREK